KSICVLDPTARSAEWNPDIEEAAPWHRTPEQINPSMEKLKAPLLQSSAMKALHLQMIAPSNKPSEEWQSPQVIERKTCASVESDANSFEWKRLWLPLCCSPEEMRSAVHE